jgi:cytochrome c peroxidase
MKSKFIIWPGVAAITLILTAGFARAQVAVPPPTFLPLNQIRVPEPPNLFTYVKDRAAAIRLGKAFYWDMQVGSDGIQACASCHFHAGADNRMKNTINPDTRSAVSDTTFQVRGPNETLQPTDFPFHDRLNPELQNSPVIRDSNDVVGSQGVVLSDFTGLTFGSAIDSALSPTADIFNAAGVNMRRVTARNTPSNINAVFNFSNFWDGRAHFTFNGSSPFGPLDATAGVWFVDPVAGLVKKDITADPTLRIEFASLASQATGPPLDDIEMSGRGRTFPMVGRKMLNNGLIPLGKQMVHPLDSVLGPLSRAVLDPVTGKMSGQPGLNTTYAQMIKDAFVDKLWNSPGLTTPGGFTQMEANFSLFWGLAIQLYEATLVSDQTPFDRFLGGDTTALTIQQQNGFNLFFGGGILCSACHAGTELTNASVTAAAFVTNASNALIEQMTVASGQSIIYDNGFNNTADRPITDDIGRGGNSPFTNSITLLPLPLSFSALSELQATANLPFATPLLPANLAVNFPVQNNGGFKVPGLRNVELTAPYFHNGGMLTLDQVVDFYTRGGNFPVANVSALDVAIKELGALQNNPTNQAALVAFLMSLTDERVRIQSAPFDHPELFVPNLDPNIVTPDVLTKIPAKDQFGNDAPAIALTLNQFPSITNRANLPIGGVNETGATVAVKVNNGAPIAAAVAGTSWTATIPLVTGANNVTVTSTQGVNTTTVRAAVTFRPADGCLSTGCLNGGPVSIIDAIKALRFAVALATPTPDDELLHGDVAPLVNGVPAPDGRIDVSDALVILKKVVGLINF